MIKKLSNKKLAHYMQNNNNVSKHKSRSIRVARTRKNVSRRTRKFLRGGAEGPVKIPGENVKVVQEPVKVPPQELSQVPGGDAPYAITPFATQREQHNTVPPRHNVPLPPASPLAPHHNETIIPSDNQPKDSATHIANNRNLKTFSNDPNTRDDTGYMVMSHMGKKTIDEQNNKKPFYANLDFTNSNSLNTNSSSTDPSPNYEKIIPSAKQLKDFAKQIIANNTKKNKAINNIEYTNMYKQLQYNKRLKKALDALRYKQSKQKRTDTGDPQHSNRMEIASYADQALAETGKKISKLENSMQTIHKKLPLKYILRSLLSSTTIKKQVNKEIANNLFKIKENANKPKISNYKPYFRTLYNVVKEAKAKEAKKQANVAAKQEANKRQGPGTLYNVVKEAKAKEAKAKAKANVEAEHYAIEQYGPLRDGNSEILSNTFKTQREQERARRAQERARDILQKFFQTQEKKYPN